VKRIHQRLSLVMINSKENPWNAEEKNHPIQDKERGKARFSYVLVGPIEPEDLRESNKWNRTVTDIEQGSINDRDKKEIDSF
jgi:hypothetical protein